LFGSCWYILTPDDSPEAKAERALSNTRVTTTTICELEMEGRLTSPGTADFPFGHVASVTALVNEDHYRLRSYVDSQNALGGTNETGVYCRRAADRCTRVSPAHRRVRGRVFSHGRAPMTAPCRVCHGEVATITRLAQSSWVLCRTCLSMHRTPIDTSFTDRFISNVGYPWGLTHGDGFSEASFARDTNYSGTWWEFFAARTALRSTATVLDFGSGTGPLLEYLKGRDLTVTGLEPSAQNRDFSQRHGHTVIGEFLQGGMFNDQSVDVIHLCNSGQFVPDLARVFRIFHDILTPDGVVFMGDKGYRWSSGRARSVFQREHAACYFSYPALCNLMALTGFEVVFYRNLFGEFKMIARKVRLPITPRLRGSFACERLLLALLPVTERAFQMLHRTILSLPSPMKRLAKILGRQLQVLPDRLRPDG
jgi:SAM-dependent methyltransferase